jgi:hypothetical protein
VPERVRSDVRIKTGPLTRPPQHLSHAGGSEGHASRSTPDLDKHLLVINEMLNCVILVK